MRQLATKCQSVPVPGLMRDSNEAEDDVLSGLVG